MSGKFKKFVVNGVEYEYSNSSTFASEVDYNDVKSNLDVSNVQDAIDTLSDICNDAVIHKSYGSNNGKLEISDENGNVITSFENGHIKTAKFDSENISIDNQCDIISISDFNEKGRLEISDPSGNIIASFVDGGIKTAKFDSNNYAASMNNWTEYKTNDGDNPVNIPEPRLAKLNILLKNFDLRNLSKVGRGGAIQGKNYDIPCEIEFYDGVGNFFKKKALISGQGNSSMSMERKSIAIDFFDDEYDGDAFSIRFGDWVAQDSFHMKSLYTDFFVGGSYIAYKLSEQIDLTRGVFNDRPWKKSLIDFSKITSNQTSLQIDDLNLQLDNSAKCHPDGFPVIIYHNNEFYGIFVFSLKKHRNNYHHDKKTPEHIQLDGTLSPDNIWNGVIDWKQFEIRNPKASSYLFLQKDGTVYDADLNCDEIMGEDSEFYTGTKNQKICVKVKKYITNLSKYIPQIKELAKTDEQAAKDLFNQHFDVDNLIDYEITQLATGDTDGFAKNWQWVTYDGIKWYVCEYDKDMSWGGYFTGSFTQSAPSLTGGYWMGNSTDTPLGWVIRWYKNDIRTRWNYLVQKNILTYDNIINMFKNWIDRIGVNNYILETEKWPDKPCNRNNNVDTTHWNHSFSYISSNWSSSSTYNINNYCIYSGKCYKSLSSNNINNKPTETLNVNWEDVTYNQTKTYNVGDVCYYGKTMFFKFTAISENIGNPPITNFYTKYPYELGYHDSFWRLCKYVNERLESIQYFMNQDKNFN